MSRKLNAKVFPFRENKEKALMEFVRSSSKILSPKLRVEDAKNFRMFEVYVPFWAFDVVIKASYVARIGFKHRSVIFDEKLNRFVDFFRFNYRVYAAEHYSKHTKNDPGMQMYSSTKLWREFTNVLTGFKIPDIDQTENEKNSKYFAPIEFDEAFLEHNSRHIEQIRLRPAVVWPRVLEYVQEQEKKKAVRELTEKFKADRVEIKKMEIDVLARKAAAFFVPAFVFNYNSAYLKNLQAIVSGLDAKRVAFVDEYCPFKTFAAMFSVSALSNMIFSALFFFDPILVSLFTFLPSILAMWVSRLFPRRKLQGLRRKAVEDKKSFEEYQKRICKKTFDDEESFGYYSNLFAEQESSHKSRSKRYAESYNESKRLWSEKERQKLDPLGLYNLLGLKLTRSQVDKSERPFTETDIAAAFKMKAQELHPDRVLMSKKKGAEKKTNELEHDLDTEKAFVEVDLDDGESTVDYKEIQKRTEEFRKVLAAYQILRNPEKRKIYDSKGIVE